MSGCQLCEKELHIQNCPGCGRSCKCFDHVPEVHPEPLTAKWETDILKAFIERHGARNVRQAITRLEEQLG